MKAVVRPTVRAGTATAAALNLSYAMDPAGDVGGIADGASGAGFRYDLDGRLAAYDLPPGATAPAVKFGYAGDRIVEATDSGSGRRLLAFGYDDQSNVSAISAYDAAGTAIVKTICLVHDALGRLGLVGYASPTVGGPDALACRSEGEVVEVVARFKYDAWNRRVARWTAATGEWTEYVHGPDGSLLAELARPAMSGGAWSVKREYVWIDHRPLAQVEYPGPAGGAEGYAYYFHLDHLGTPRALTNGAGQVVWRTDGRPYGDVTETTMPDPLTGRTVVTNLRLPGQYDERLLASVGLQGPYYNWNRWYLPSVGRYLELDPIALVGGFNGGYGPDWYNYASGNAMSFTDVMGLDVDVCFYAEGAGYLGHVGFGPGGSGNTEGYYPTGNPHASPGIVKPDTAAMKECKTIPSDKKGDDCMKACRERRARDPGTYRIWSRQCTSFVRDCLKECGLPVPEGDGAYPEPFYRSLPGESRVPPAALPPRK